MLHTRRTPHLNNPAACCAGALAVLLALAALLGASSSSRALSGLQATGDQALYLPVVRTSGLPIPFDPYATRTGQATFYDADGGGNCSFDPSPADLMVAAMNHTDYRDSLICGAYIQVAGPKGTIVVRIVDQCPECPEGNIDLSAEAFALIADPVQGRVAISWRLISPALSGPIVYHFKDGSSKWWLAVQIRNHRNPIWQVEFQDTDGAFKALERQSYNYFVEPQYHSGPVPELLSLRVTDIYGSVITDSGIALVAETSAAGSAQFPDRP
jgi:expansin (peptidoglycan-binding protein)